MIQTHNDKIFRELIQIAYESTEDLRKLVSTIK